jgi:transposase
VSAADWLALAGVIAGVMAVLAARREHSGYRPHAVVANVAWTAASVLDRFWIGVALGVAGIALVIGRALWSRRGKQAAG